MNRPTFRIPAPILLALLACASVSVAGRDFTPRIFAHATPQRRLV